MKKIYLSPAIETLEVRAAFAICDPSPGSGGTGGTGLPGGTGGSWPAPERIPLEA